MNTSYTLISGIWRRNDDKIQQYSYRVVQISYNNSCRLNNVNYSNTGSAKKKMVTFYTSYLIKYR